MNPAILIRKNMFQFYSSSIKTREAQRKLQEIADVSIL